MSQEEFYQTVMQEQLFLETRLKDYKLHREYLQNELDNVTHALDEIQNKIAILQKQLGDISDSN